MFGRRCEGKEGGHDTGQEGQRKVVSRLLLLLKNFYEDSRFFIDITYTPYMP